jgi:uncharacterized protein
MERLLFDSLKKWKVNPRRKPLIIQGARQVGKTWLMKEFGKVEFKRSAYFNFESTKELHGIFSQGFQIGQILSALSILAGFRVDEDDCLLIFDEIQECPEAITSLKYFSEEQPEIPIISAGSLLGVAIHQGVSFPVGKVEFMQLYPLNFHEFLLAKNKKDLLNLLESGNTDLIAVFKNQYTSLLKQYYFVGGMPEAVKVFSETDDYNIVREIQLNILKAYENDFSKHAPIGQLPRIRLVWQSILSQLAKENSKFIYNVLRPGARAKDFEMAIDWLKDAGLIHKVTRLNKSGFPLASYADWADFKIFFNDVGLLCAMANLAPELLLRGDYLFVEFKGIISEQFVLQQLISVEIEPFYWNPENNRSELDFVIQSGERIIPIEVKAAENVKAKSLSVYFERYKPEICIRTSLSGYKKQDWMENVPLYGFLQRINQVVCRNS